MMKHKLMVCFFILSLILLQTACISNRPQTTSAEQTNAIFQVKVAPGVSYQDVVDSLKINSQGMNFVNPANFPIGEQLKLRGLSPEGPMEVRTYCSLSLGAEILQDHPEFLVFAPCRIALYQTKGQLYLALSRPTADLKNIKNPTERAIKAAQALEDSLISLITKASKGDF